MCHPPQFQTDTVWRQFLVGLAIRGPVIHYWYLALDRLFQSWDQAKLSTAIAKGMRSLAKNYVRWFGFMLSSRPCTVANSVGRSAGVLAAIQLALLLCHRIFGGPVCGADQSSRVS